MNKLKELENMNFKITWKLINIGLFGNELIKSQITKKDIYDFEEELLANNSFNFNDVVLLTDKSLSDTEFRELIYKFSKNEKTEMKFESEKWIVYLTKKMLDTLNKKDYFNSLLEISDFWISLGQPKNSPHIFQAVNNNITPKEYYTKEMFEKVLYMHENWIKKEVKQISIRENG